MVKDNIEYINIGVLRTQSNKMELSANYFLFSILTFFAKSSILDVQADFGYASDKSYHNLTKFSTQNVT